MIISLTGRPADRPARRASFVFLSYRRTSRRSEINMLSLVAQLESASLVPTAASACTTHLPWPLHCQTWVPYHLGRFAKLLLLQPLLGRPMLPATRFAIGAAAAVPVEGIWESKQVEAAGEGAGKIYHSIYPRLRLSGCARSPGQADACQKR